MVSWCEGKMAGGWRVVQCVDCPYLLKTLRTTTLLQVIVMSVSWAHVCVQQTAIDLIKAGIEVHIVADATSSRSQMDRLFAFDRLRQAGAIITTSESVLLQLVGDKNHLKFKEVQGLIKVSAPESGLVNKL